MKKLILTLCFAVASLAASSQNTNETITTAKTNVKSSGAIKGISDFSNPIATEYLTKYNAYAEFYIKNKGKVLRNNEFMQGLRKLSSDRNEILGKLGTPDSKKFHAIMKVIYAKLASFPTT